MNVNSKNSTDLYQTLPDRYIESWRKTILHHAKYTKPRKFLRPAEQLKAIARNELTALRNLWQTYTTERGGFNRYRSNPKQQSISYLLGFHLPNAVRLQLIFQRLLDRHSLVNLMASYKNQIDVYDIGCGTGAMGLTLLSCLLQAYPKIEQKLMIRYYDSKQANLECVKTFQHFFAEQIPAQFIKTDLKDLRFPKQIDQHSFAIITIGYLYNEIKTNKALKKKLVNYLGQFIDSQCHLLVFLLEPANEHIAKDAMSFHDELLTDGFNVLYPCPCNMPCPMLSTQNPGKDWCYSEGLWQQNPEQVFIDRLLNINRRNFSTSGYVFGSAKTKQALQSSPEMPAVIVGRPTIKSAKSIEQYKLLLCTADGIIKTSPDHSSKHLRGTLFF